MTRRPKGRRHLTNVILRRLAALFLLAALFCKQDRTIFNRLSTTFTCDCGTDRTWTRFAGEPPYSRSPLIGIFDPARVQTSWYRADLKTGRSK